MELSVTMFLGVTIWVFMICFTVSLCVSAFVGAKYPRAKKEEQ